MVRLKFEDGPLAGQSGDVSESKAKYFVTIRDHMYFKSHIEFVDLGETRLVSAIVYAHVKEAQCSSQCSPQRQ